MASICTQECMLGRHLSERMSTTLFTGPTAGPPTAAAEHAHSIWIVWLYLSAALLCLLAFCTACIWVGRVRRRRWAAARARHRARAAAGAAADEASAV